ncbi:MAG: CRISPR-associated endonuclease Cas1 1 [Armatimonadota bacterium]|nr:MAG: CRISPR-associated endonuclease Cas1 1 [Armatimonadota bacterium]
MTTELLNTLYVFTQGAYVHLDGDTVRVDLKDERLKQTPLHHLGAIVTFGLVTVSPYLMHRCAEDGRAVTFMDVNGRFLARVEGATSGNVLLRKAQYETHRDESAAAAVARCIVAGKLQNCRGVLNRAIREAGEGQRAKEAVAALSRAAEAVAGQLKSLEEARSLDAVRGAEGHGSAAYFEAFDSLITQQRTDFRFDSRSRRPPKDRVNALLSFLYALLVNDCRAACEGVGLDPQFGFLHAIRPGRPALALDLMEEFRAPFADRLALTLINRKQIGPEDFRERPGGAVLLNEDGRKKVVVAYQTRKQTEVSHPMLKTRVPLGVVPHLQARILARCLRGDIPFYTPFIPR